MPKLSKRERFACKAAGERSGLDLVIVLHWCSPIVLLWISSSLREKRIGLKVDTCRAGDHLSCLKTLAVWQKYVCA